MVYPQKRNNDRPALIALIGILIIFVAIVGRGWHGLFNPFGLPIAILVGLVVALIASSLAYAIAIEHVQNPQAKSTAAAYFFVLFNISALGTVNAMFLTFQGTNVLREESQRAESTIAKFKGIAANEFKPRLLGYDEFKSLVENKKDKLIQEILDPLNCGQGVLANRYAQELQILLPNFRLSGAKANCQNASVVAGEYEKSIPALLKNSTQYLKVKEDADLRTEFTSVLSQIDARSAKIQKMLISNEPALSIKAELFENADEYLKLRSQFKGGRFPNENSWPERIDTSAVSALGDIGQVIPFILSRLGEISTYIYLLIALVLDVTVIAAFVRVVRVGPSPTHQRILSTPHRL